MANVYQSQYSKIAIKALNADSASYALTASYAMNGGSGGGSTDTGSLLKTASAAGNTITFTKGDGSTFPVTVAGGTGAPGGSNTQIQFNSASVFSGSGNLRFDYVTNTIHLTGSISASSGANTVGFFGTSSWAQSSSQAISSSYTLSASYALTASHALNGGGSFTSTSSFIGNGLSSSFNINHGFNTRNLHITVYESGSNGETVYPDIRRINANTASIIFANPPSTDQYIVYISQ